MKIGILIPTTSHQRNWKTMEETYLYNYTLKSLLKTYDSEHEYVVYIGCDDDDRLFSQQNIKDELIRFVQIMKNVEIEFVSLSEITKGHVTKMWTRLFHKAYDDGCEYFYQCGDDIDFKTSGWVNDAIKILQEHDNMGVTGPKNENPRIITQTFVSRKHREIFEYYFPPEIINWCCDDWINVVYRPKYFYPLTKHFSQNMGGRPRYMINHESALIKLNYVSCKYIVIILWREIVKRF